MTEQIAVTPKEISKTLVTLTVVIDGKDKSYSTFRLSQLAAGLRDDSAQKVRINNLVSFLEIGNSFNTGVEGFFHKETGIKALKVFLDSDLSTAEQDSGVKITVSDYIELFSEVPGKPGKREIKQDSIKDISIKVVQFDFISMLASFEGSPLSWVLKPERGRKSNNGDRSNNTVEKEESIDLLSLE